MPIKEVDTPIMDRVSLGTTEMNTGGAAETIFVDQTGGDLEERPSGYFFTLPLPYAGFLQTHIEDLVGNVVAFVTACNDCLPLMPQGFYKFQRATVLGLQL